MVSSASIWNLSKTRIGSNEISQIAGNRFLRIVSSACNRSCSVYGIIFRLAVSKNGMFRMRQFGPDFSLPSRVPERLWLWRPMYTAFSSYVSLSYFWSFSCLNSWVHYSLLEAVVIGQRLWISYRGIAHTRWCRYHCLWSWVPGTDSSWSWQLCIERWCASTSLHLGNKEGNLRGKGTDNSHLFRLWNVLKSLHTFIKREELLQCL